MLRALLKSASLAGFIVLAAGAFMTWSDNAPFSKKGVDQSDGVLVLVIALAGIALTIFGRRPRAVLINASMAGLALLVALLNLVDVSSSVASVGSGLYLALAGAAVASAAGAAVMFLSLKKPEAVPSA